MCLFGSLPPPSVTEQYLALVILLDSFAVDKDQFNRAQQSECMLDKCRSQEKKVTLSVTYLFDKGVPLRKCVKCVPYVWDGERCDCLGLIFSLDWTLILLGEILPILSDCQIMGKPKLAISIRANQKPWIIGKVHECLRVCVSSSQMSLRTSSISC